MYLNFQKRMAKIQKAVTKFDVDRDNTQLARKLAQKAYDEKVIKLAEKRLGQIKKITKGN